MLDAIVWPLIRVGDFLRIGLTGGIGSGKSSVAKFMVNLGASLVDADEVSKSMTGPDGPAIKFIRDVFGNEFLTSQRAMNRDRMRGEIFQNPTAKRKLESILHPLIQSEIIKQTQRFNLAGVSCVVLDIPLLMETSHWRSFVDAVCVVDCLESTQIHRVMERNGLAEHMIKKVLSNQLSRQNRLQGADIVLFNDGITMQQLALEVKAIAPKIGL
ncbi:MAG: dephospho-CoA kinase [Burkholderiales bacterium PBB4]|nr:MAG: dephospho-CoA kinase [Burkholderiales bacterium PBB4]